MKLARVGLAIITSLALMLSVCLPVQASEESGDVDLSATVPLAISDVSASSIGYYGATISWKTNGDATSRVFYDTEFHDNIADYVDSTIEETTLVTEHSVRLTGLSSGRTYHYRVRSAAVIDDNDFIAISEDYTFRTLSPAVGVRPAVYYIDTDLFTIEGSFRISRTGEILKTIEATSEDEMLTLAITEGTIALNKDGKRLKSLQAIVDETPPDPPEDAHIIGLAYDFGPEKATFDPPITLEYTYDPGALPEGLAWLVLAYYDEEAGEWVELPCTVDPVTHTITASVAHFTTFAIIGTVPPVPPPPPPPAPARFSLSDLTVQPAKVQPKEAVTITVTVANTGGKSGSYTVILKIDGVKEAEKSATVAAGGTKTVSFSVSREETGTYSIAVDGLGDSFTILAPATFSVTKLSIEPTGVRPAEAVTVSVTVANTGGVEGSYSLVLKINGVKEEEKSVTVAPGGTETVAFSVTREDPGIYSVDVDGLSGGFTVVIVAPPPGINWPLIGGIIGVIVIAGLVVFFRLRRRGEVNDDST